MTWFSAVETENFITLLSVNASASAFESFENATALGSMIFHFAVHAAVFLIIFVCTVSAEISWSTAAFISSPSMLAISSVVTVESGSS
jgi:hypothetical protein